MIQLPIFVFLSSWQRPSALHCASTERPRWGIHPGHQGSCYFFTDHSSSSFTHLCPGSARSAPSAQRPISEHHDWQLRNNCGSQNFPSHPSSQFDTEFFLILNSRGSNTALGSKEDPRPHFYDDFVTFNATLSQLYVPQPSPSPQDPSQEPLERKDKPLRGRHSASITRDNSTDPPNSSTFSTGESTNSLSTPGESFSLPRSSGPLQAHPPTTMAKLLHTLNKPCTSAPNVPAVPSFGFSLNSRTYTNDPILPSKLQNPLTPPSRHAKTHSKPYACRAHPNCVDRFAEQRDRQRHEAKHGQARGIAHYFCPYHNCGRSSGGGEGGFGVREDNAKRHVRSRHGGSTMAPLRIIV
jgi:hypothetical protein